ncbi:MAG: IS5 family transposase [Bacteroidetes bacterium]|nr:IS5 family transposase [Bacteroidota bacterium]
MSQKIKNWSEYNKSLINRGSLTFWISEDVVRSWRSSKKTSKAGRPEKYSDSAIQAICMVRFFFHLTLRSTEGFIRSLFNMMQITLPVPSYSRISRRMKWLNLDYKKLSSHKPTHIAIDSTGVKIYGDGEWHVKIHGESKRKKWKKMTLGVCPKTHEILFTITSDESFGDPTLFKMTMDHLPKSVKDVLMDGAGDSYEMYRLAERERVNLITPPRKGSKYKIGIDRSKRDETVQMIYKMGNNEEALKKWKKLRGYHRRSLVETAISRIKGILGNTLKSRSLINQHHEMLLKSLIINKLNTLGLPVRT